MTKDTPTRKAQLKAAMALAGVSQREWAEQHGVTVQHLHAVLSGRDSVRLLHEVDAFIAETLKQPVAQAS